MPLFICDKCKTIENTALCRYWSRDQDTKGKALCSECDPKIKKWHGEFEKIHANDYLSKYPGMSLLNKGRLTDC